MKIDIQCHIFPLKFIRKTKHDRGQFRIDGSDDRERMAIADSATQSTLAYFIPDSPFFDPEKHLEDMKYDVDLQVLSVNPPGVDRIKDGEEAYCEKRSMIPFPNWLKRTKVALQPWLACHLIILSLPCRK